MDPKQNQQINQVPQQPISPVSGGPKEALRPIGQSREWVSASTPEIVLPQEVQQAGVEAKPLVPQVPQSAQEAGLQPAKETAPVGSVTMEHISLKTPHPLILQLKKIHKNVKESFSWLLELISRQQDREENGGNA